MDSRFAQEEYAEIIQEACQQAIATRGHDEFADGAIVTKWVCLMEVMDTKGEKWMMGFRGPTPNTIPVWDAKGMLLYAAEDMEFMDDKDEEDGDAV